MKTLRDSSATIITPCIVTAHSPIHGDTVQGKIPESWSARLRTTKSDRQSGGLQGVAESVLERMSPERGKELARIGDSSFAANPMSIQGLWLMVSSSTVAGGYSGQHLQ